MVDFAGWIVILFAAMLDWAAVKTGWSRAKFVTKPLVMILLILWLTLHGGWKGPMLWFTLGAVLSLAGDISLMLPGRFFLAGLISFLVAHGFYITGFLAGPLKISTFWIVSCLVVVTFAILITRRIRHGIHQATGARRLRWAVTIYSVAVTGMFLSTLSTINKPGWNLLNSFVVVLGGSLFYLSDTLLAYDRFVTPVKNGRLIVRISYHVGQILILGGALNHYAS